MKKASEAIAVDVIRGYVFIAMQVIESLARHNSIYVNKDYGIFFEERVKSDVESAVGLIRAGQLERACELVDIRTAVFGQLLFAGANTTTRNGDGTALREM